MKLHHFASFEEFESAVVDVDLKVRLLGPQDGRWRLGHVDVGGIVVQQGIEVVPNLCEAAGWPTHLMFLISDSSHSPTWLNGVPFASDKVGILAPKKGFVFRGAGPNAWVTIALPVSSWLLHGDNELGQVLRQWSQSTHMLTAPASLIQSLRTAALIAANLQSCQEDACTLIENAIMALAYARKPPSAVGRPGVSPHELCDTALNLFRTMDMTGGGSRGFGGVPVGARSLRNFFHHCFGYGPVQYLHLRQLHTVHGALRNVRERSVSIAEVFERQGCTYSTYTLARYRAIFGEAPSATRARIG